MNPQDPLAALQPLREPGLIGWWPLAPGWWVVIALITLATAALAWFLYRRWQQRAYRRQALAELESLRANTELSWGEYAAALNALLKAVALRSYGQRKVAALHGEAWLEFLSQTRGQGEALSLAPALSDTLYARGSQEGDRDSLAASAGQWIKQHRVAA